MGDQPRSDSDTAFEEIAYLVRSEHRSAALEHLEDGPYEPKELVELTGASRPTLGRILGELEERGWVERSGGGYVATPVGEAIVTEFEPFRGAVEAIDRLGNAVAWIPREATPIELRHFRSATVQSLGEDDPVDALEFMTGLIQGASTWGALTHLMAPARKREAMLQGVQTDRLEAVNVLTGEVIDRLLEGGDKRAWLQEYLEAGATVARYDGSIPCNLFVIDELVLIGDSHPGSDNPYTAIVSENETVRRWAMDIIDGYLADSERLSTDLLEGDPDR